MLRADDMRALVRRELDRPGIRLGFTPELEQLFEWETRVARARHLIHAGTLALIFSNLFLIADANLIPDVFDRSVALHVVGSIVYGAVLLYTAMQPPARWRETGHGLGTAMGLLGTIGLLHASHAPDRYYLCLAYVLYIVYVNVVLRLRFGWCLAFNIVGTLAALGVVLGGDVPAGVRDMTALSLLTAGVFSLFASYTIEGGERRGFLLMLDQRLCAEQLAVSNAKLNTLSTTDWLTGVANRRGLERRLNQLWQAAGPDITLAMLMIDVDHFKLFNDHRGHPAGDSCLATLAALIGQQLRQDHDVLGRYGGEEFGVLLPGASLAEAIGAAERVRQAVEDLALVHGANEHCPFVTVSVGVAVASPHQGEAVEQLIAIADQALYEAKQAGRNRVHPSLVTAMMRDAIPVKA